MQRHKHNTTRKQTTTNNNIHIESNDINIEKPKAQKQNNNNINIDSNNINIEKTQKSKINTIIHGNIMFHIECVMIIINRTTTVL